MVALAVGGCAEDLESKFVQATVESDRWIDNRYILRLHTTSGEKYTAYVLDSFGRCFCGEERYHFPVGILDDRVQKGTLLKVNKERLKYNARPDNISTICTASIRLLEQQDVEKK